jgi:hypothetical protein
MQEEWIMKTPKTATSLIAIVIALWLATVGTFWKSNAATPSPQPHLFSTGMFGVARGQTARINAVCLPPGPCHPEMMFFDSMGNVVARSEGRELAAGQSSFFDLPYIERPTESLRIELRAVGSFSDRSNETKGPAPHLLFTGEVFDNDTLKTTFFVPSNSFEDCACGGPIPENQ